MPGGAFSPFAPPGFNSDATARSHEPRSTCASLLRDFIFSGRYFKKVQSPTVSTDRWTQRRRASSKWRHAQNPLRHRRKRQMRISLILPIAAAFAVVIGASTPAAATDKKGALKICNKRGNCDVRGMPGGVNIKVGVNEVWCPHKGPCVCTSCPPQKARTSTPGPIKVGGVLSGSTATTGPATPNATPKPAPGPVVGKPATTGSGPVVVRDHRTPPAVPVVRDHRAGSAPVVRDHRANPPVIRDHTGNAQRSTPRLSSSEKSRR